RRLGEHAPLDRLRGGRIAEFLMPGVQQVLADDGDLESWDRRPAEPEVKLAVSRRQDVRIGNATHVAVSGVDLEVPGKVERRSQGEMVLRVGRFRRTEAAVEAPR